MKKTNEKKLKSYNFLEFPESLSGFFYKKNTWGINPNLSEKDFWPVDIEQIILKKFQDIEDKIVFDQNGKNQKLIPGSIYYLNSTNNPTRIYNCFSYYNNEKFYDYPALFLGCGFSVELSTCFVLESQDHERVVMLVSKMPKQAIYKKVCLYQTVDWIVQTRWLHFGGLEEFNFILADSKWNEYDNESSNKFNEKDCYMLNFPTRCMTHDIDQMSGFEVKTHDEKLKLFANWDSIPRMDNESLIKTCKKYPGVFEFDLINKKIFENEIKLNDEINISFNKKIFVNGKKIN